MKTFDEEFRYRNLLRTYSLQKRHRGNGCCGAALDGRDQCKRPGGSHLRLWKECLQGGG